MLFTVWIIAQLTLVAVAVIDPRLASTFARMSFLVIGAVGGAFTLFLAMRGQDRALSLIPTWILFLIWIFGAAMALTGRLSGDIVVSGLVAGLVLILVLIGFTVTQFAFRSLEPLFGAAPSETAASRAGGRRRRVGRLGMECAARRGEGQPGHRGFARPQSRRAVHQGRRLHQAPASRRIENASA